jgi:mRNA interferase MazF
MVVLTRDSALEFLGEVTVAPITSTFYEIPTEVPLAPADGMATDCAFNLDYVQTGSRGQVRALITTLPEQELREIRKALLAALGLDH